jgi:hypothetical protein
MDIHSIENHSVRWMADELLNDIRRGICRIEGCMRQYGECMADLDANNRTVFSNGRQYVCIPWCSFPIQFIGQQMSICRLIGMGSTLGLDMTVPEVVKVALHALQTVDCNDVDILHSYLKSRMIQDNVVEPIAENIWWADLKSTVFPPTVLYVIHGN